MTARSNAPRARRAIYVAACFAAIALLAIAVYEGLRSQPLFVEYDLATPRQAPVVAVLVSGDMGLGAGMGYRIVERLQRAGVPTLGINTPAFFMHHRDADAIGRLVEQAVQRSLAAHPEARLILVGQSFGADVLPVGVNRLSPDLKRRLQLVALIVPTRTAYYRISLAEFFGSGTPDARAADEASAIREVPLLCVQGALEADSLCPELQGPNVRRVALPGGHMLHHDADRLFAVLEATMSNAA